MGMYTEFFFVAEVNEEAYDQLSRFMLWDGSSSLNRYVAPHPFFGLTRAGSLLNGWSSLSAGVAVPLELRKDTHYAGPAYTLTLRTSFKNYDGEINSFLEWVTPHVVATTGIGGFVGYSLYEEAETPTVYLVRDGKLVTGDVVVER